MSLVFLEDLSPQQRYELTQTSEAAEATEASAELFEGAADQEIAAAELSGLRDGELPVRP